MIFDLIEQPIAFLFLALALVLAITVHEFAHALVADRLGDPTARLAGRVTLNPLAHLDVIGTLALLLFRFGWGKPVPVNDQNFKNPVLDELQVSLAGPFANLVLAVLAGLSVRLIALPDLALIFASLVVQINLVLMVFNLLPIPPLDGSRILKLFLPQEAYATFEQFGVFFILAIFFLGGNLIASLYTATVIPLSSIILGI